MTTIILTIIGILLAAAAALMVIFYGGDAFNSGSVGAQANTYQNAGTNVISAAQLYRADGKASPTSVGQLTTADASTGEKYLAELPALPAKADGSANSGEIVGTNYVVEDVTPAVCTRINTNLKLGAAPATVGATKMGCVTSGADANTFFAKL